MLRKISGLLLIGLILIFNGCASTLGGSKREPKLIWNLSYVRGVVLAREALSAEEIKFGNAVINKDTAQLEGSYADGRLVQIIISNLKPSESTLALRVSNSLAPQEEAKKLLELIARYAQQRKQSL